MSVDLISYSVYPRFRNAIIIGHTTQETSRIWVCVESPGTYSLIVSAQPLTDLLQSAGARSSQEIIAGTTLPLLHDRHEIFLPSLTHTFRITGLKPGKRYFYALLSDDTESIDRVTGGDPEHHFFYTLPENPRTISFGFYSCHDLYSQFSRGGTCKPANSLWPEFDAKLKNAQADFVIGGGDQIYIDSGQFETIWDWMRANRDDILADYANGRMLKDSAVPLFAEVYRLYYRIYWQPEKVRKIFGQYPQYMIWDDHEILDGWGSYFPQELQKKINKDLGYDEADPEKLDMAEASRWADLMFRAASQVYYEFQHSHNPPGNPFLPNPAEMVWDYSFSQGAFAFYVMDMRGHHDINNWDKQTVLLGEAQHQRFSAWLNTARTSGAKALFVVVPVPLVHWSKLVEQAEVGEATDDVRDEWGSDRNIAERDRVLLQLLEFSHTQKKPVLLLSGDVHSASCFRLSSPDFPDARVSSVTASGISKKSSFALTIRNSGKLSKAHKISCKQETGFKKNNFALIRASVKAGDAVSITATIFSRKSPKSKWGEESFEL